MRNTLVAVLVVVAFACINMTVAVAQSTPPPTQPGASAGGASVGGAGGASALPAGEAANVDKLREQLKTAYAQGDIDAMLKYLHPQVVIIFPDGRILNGPGALKQYYNEMLHGPNHRVQSYTSDPVVTERYLHGDTVVSFGKMNDHYVLTDGNKFGLDSRFTTTAIRLPDGPPETGGWMIRSFHSSTDAFDNPVLKIVMRKTFWTSAIGALIVGIFVGIFLTRATGKRRATASTTTTTTSV
jgi:hypothetical protein